MAKVNVLFWFDVEDYITPQSDDALLRLLEIFDRNGVKGIWKIVGEQLRMMERRGRGDIIERLTGHDVGYHTDWHSVHPTVSEYLEPLNWADGAAEFERRERPGMDDMERVFGKGAISCYGQPGSSWGPQAYPVLKDWGIPVYLDELHLIGLNEQPFWYCNMLNVLRLRQNVTRLNLNEGMAGLPAAQAAVSSIVERLRTTGGVASIYYHPNEWVTSEFWDAANFARGENTPRQSWRLPKLKTPAEVEEGFNAFEAYLRFVRDQPDVEIITAKDLLALYPDRAQGKHLSLATVRSLAAQLCDEITYLPLDQDAALAPVEAFSLIIGALAGYGRMGALAQNLSFISPLGPTEPYSDASGQPEYVRWNDLVVACTQAEQFIHQGGYLPSSPAIGEHRMSPARFLATASGALVRLLEAGRPPETVALQPGNFTLDRQVTPDRAWNWVIFPPNFSAPNLVSLAKLQTWTLKPATQSKV